MHTLTRREEEDMLKELYARAREHCDPAIKEFAACAAANTYTVAWRCRDLNKAMNKCLRDFRESDEMQQLKLAKLRDKYARAAAAAAEVETTPITLPKTDRPT